MNYKKIIKQPLLPFKYFINLISYNAIIFTYHRIVESEVDPWSLAVSPINFAEQMEIIGKYGDPISLNDLVRKLIENKPIRRSIVVTFDDGYRDSLYIAKPLLEKQNVPATVFIPTSYIDQKRVFWWDELDRLLIKSEHLPSTLKLNIQDKIYILKTEEPGFLHWSSINTFEENNHASNIKKYKKALSRRKNLYHKIYNLIKFLPDTEREKVLIDIRKSVGVDSSNENNQFLLSSKELIRLVDGGLIDIGSHTKTHPNLSKISLSMQKDEIIDGKVCIENIIGQKVNSFSYPHGGYTENTISLVKEAGFRCACSTIFGGVNRNSNLYLLSRIGAKNFDGEKFARWMSKINLFAKNVI